MDVGSDSCSLTGGGMLDINGYEWDITLWLFNSLLEAMAH
jgi:hypothetical protein